MSEWSTREDALLVSACLEGNEQAWEALLERYSRLLYTIILRFGFSPPIADEVYQEICLILLQKLDTLQDRQQLRTWLVTITRRTCLQYLRQKDQNVSIENAELNQLITNSLEQQLLWLERLNLVQQALAHLDERCRYLLNMLFFETPQPSYDTLAAHLNIATGSIGPNRIRCLEKLRVEILRLEGSSVPAR